MKRGRRYYPVWHSLPGVVAAYQPARAPDATRAMWNVGSHMGQVGKNDTTPGVAPTWTPMGWTFNGSTQYLRTQVVNSGNQTILIRFSDVANTGFCIGESGDTYFAGIAPIRGSDPAGVRYGYNAHNFDTAPTMLSGVLGLVGSACYRNGVFDRETEAWIGNEYYEFYIGGMNDRGLSNYAPYAGKILLCAIYSRTLTPAEVWLASQQMAYCDANPDWSAWARQRQYWIVPVAIAAAAGAQIPIFGGRVWRRPGAATDAPEVGGLVVRR